MSESGKEGTVHDPVLLKMHLLAGPKQAHVSITAHLRATSRLLPGGDFTRQQGTGTGTDTVNGTTEPRKGARGS
jgi:hypothetical protein